MNITWSSSPSFSLRAINILVLTSLPIFSVFKSNLVARVLHAAWKCRWEPNFRHLWPTGARRSPKSSCPLFLRLITRVDHWALPTLPKMNWDYAVRGSETGGSARCLKTKLDVLCAACWPEARFRRVTNEPACDVLQRRIFVCACACVHVCVFSCVCASMLPQGLYMLWRWLMKHLKKRGNG